MHNAVEEHGDRIDFCNTLPGSNLLTSRIKDDRQNGHKPHCNAKTSSIAQPIFVCVHYIRGACTEHVPPMTPDQALLSLLLLDGRIERMERSNNHSNNRE